MKATLFAFALILSALSGSILAAETPPQSSALTTNHVAQKINLNTATIQTLTGSFQRIGKQRAAAIIQYRQAHGGFKSVAELAQVHGLGQAFVSSHLTQLQAVFAVE